MSTAAQFDQSQTPLPLRSDTFLGVFEAIGQDLGINANWLRIAFMPFIMFSPLITIGIYLALGAVVAATRYFFPVEAKKPAQEAEAPAAQEHEEVEERLAA